MKRVVALSVVVLHALLPLGCEGGDDVRTASDEITVTVTDTELLFRVAFTGNSPGNFASVTAIGDDVFLALDDEVDGITEDAYFTPGTSEVVTETLDDDLFVGLKPGDTRISRDVTLTVTMIEKGGDDVPLDVVIEPVER